MLGLQVCAVVLSSRCVFKGPKLEPPELRHLSSPGVLLKFLNVIYLFLCVGCDVLCHATLLEVRGQLIILSFYQMGSLRSKSSAGLVVIFFTF